MNVKLEISFDSIADAAAFMTKHLPDACPTVVMEAGALEGARQDDGSAMLPQPKINTRKLRTPKQTEPAAPATETPTQAPLVAETPAPAPVAAAPDTFVPPLGPTFTKPVTPAAPATPPAPVQEAPTVAAPDNAAAQAAIEAVFAAKGYQGAHQLLGQFGVARLRELDAAKYGELIEYANKMLAK